MNLIDHRKESGANPKPVIGERKKKFYLTKKIGNVGAKVNF